MKASAELTETMRVAGVTYHDPRSGISRQELIRRYVHPGQRLIAQREPANVHDPHAVRLLLEVPRGLGKRTYHLGYIPAERAEIVSRALRRGSVTVTVTRITGGTAELPHRGIEIAVRYDT